LPFLSEYNIIGGGNDETVVVEEEGSIKSLYASYVLITTVTACRLPEGER